MLSARFRASLNFFSSGVAMAPVLSNLSFGDKGADKERALTMYRLGELASKWGEIDEHLSVVLQQVAEISLEAGQVIFYSPASFRGRIELLRNVVNRLMPEWADKQIAVLNKAFDRLGGYHNARNTIIHAVYRFQHGFHRSSDYVRFVRQTIHPSKKDKDVEATALGPRTEIETQLRQLTDVQLFLHWITHDVPNQGAKCPVRLYSLKIMNRARDASS